MLAFGISIMTTWIAIRKRVKGEALPPLKKGMAWLGNALKWGLIRAVFNVLVVYGVGGITVQFLPHARVSRLAAAVIVGVVAGALSYLESSTAVLRTPEAGSPVALPFATKSGIR